MKKAGFNLILLVLILGLFFISYVGFVSGFNFNIFNDNKNILQVTDEHPFFVDGNWTVAKNLNVGDELFLIDGKKARITNIIDVSVDEGIEVYNLEAEKFSDFVLFNGVVVHNSDAVGGVGGKDKKYLYHGTNKEYYDLRTKEGGSYSQPDGPVFLSDDSKLTLRYALEDSRVRRQVYGESVDPVVLRMEEEGLQGVRTEGSYPTIDQIGSAGTEVIPIKFKEPYTMDLVKTLDDVWEITENPSRYLDESTIRALGLESSTVRQAESVTGYFEIANRNVLESIQSLATSSSGSKSEALAAIGKEIDDMAIQESSITSLRKTMLDSLSSAELKDPLKIAELGLSDSERIYAAKRLLGVDELTPLQEKAILAAHYTETGESQIARLHAKGNILEAGGLGEHSETLMRSGITGNPPLVKLESPENLDVLVRAGRGDTPNLESIVNSKIEVDSGVSVRRGISDSEAYTLKEQIRAAHPDWSFEQVTNELSKYGANFDSNSRSAKNLEGLVDGSGYAHAYAGHGPEAALSSNQKYFDSIEEFDRALTLGKTSPDISIPSPRGGGIVNRANYRLELDPAFPDNPFLTTILDPSGEFVTIYRQEAPEVVAALIQNGGKGNVPGAEIFTSLVLSKDGGTILMKIPGTNGGKDVILKVSRVNGGEVQASFLSVFDTSGLVPKSRLTKGEISMAEYPKNSFSAVDLSGLR